VGWGRSGLLEKRKSFACTSNWTQACPAHSLYQLHYLPPPCAHAHTHTHTQNAKFQNNNVSPCRLCDVSSYAAESLQYFLHNEWSHRVVSIATGNGLHDKDSIQPHRFFTSPTEYRPVSAPFSLYPSFRGIKWLEHQADHSPLSTAEVLGPISSSSSPYSSLHPDLANQPATGWTNQSTNYA
jgi:hypothetical protein